MKFIKSIKIFLEGVGEESIKNRAVYKEQMRKSLDDKLFFLDKIKSIDCIVDFGCADGFILSEIRKNNPEIKLIGYDIDEQMLSDAKDRNINNCLLTQNWDDVINEIKKYNNVVLNLSSVIHEVYSYTKTTQIPQFWNRVFNTGFKWVTIRDMIPSIETNKLNWIKFEDDIKKVNKLANKKLLKSFEDKWGIIDDNYRTFIHFLLKYKYVDNWDREVKENYVPISLESLKSKIKGYEIIFEEDFILPYLKYQVKKDFDIDIKLPTHVKMILKRLS